MARRDRSIHEKIYDFGAKVSFGKTADDYETHRAGFPIEFFKLLSQREWIIADQDALDLGTGTGTIAGGLSDLNCNVIGTDPSDSMLEAAKRLHPDITFAQCSAEDLPFPASSFDVVSAGQCWHWFRRAEAAAEVFRVLRPTGRVIIAHFDWLALKNNVVEVTEDLILKHNPDWAASGGTGIYPAWLTDLGNAGFTAIETASFDITQPYTHEAWRGRIRASAGIAASLPKDDVVRFDAELAARLRSEFPKELLEVPHRVWVVTAKKSK